MENNENKSLNEVKSIYSDVSEWLKFAEAKHAGLFAALIAIFIALISFDKFFEVNLIIKTYVLAIIGIGVIIELLALSPFLNRRNFIKKCCYKRYKEYGGNPLFYQSIFIGTYNYSERNDKIDKYRQMLEDNELLCGDNKWIKCYLIQIIDVSTVGTIKLFLFNSAVKYVIGSIISSVILFILIPTCTLYTDLILLVMCEIIKVIYIIKS